MSAETIDQFIARLGLRFKWEMLPNDRGIGTGGTTYLVTIGRGDLHPGFRFSDSIAHRDAGTRSTDAEVLDCLLGDACMANEHLTAGSMAAEWGITDIDSANETFSIVKQNAARLSHLLGAVECQRALYEMERL